MNRRALLQGVLATATLAWAPLRPQKKPSLEFTLGQPAAYVEMIRRELQALLDDRAQTEEFYANLRPTPAGILNASSTGSPLDS